MQKLYYINSLGGEEITFRPSEFIKVWDVHSKVENKWVKSVQIQIFIDDLKEKDLARLPKSYFRNYEEFVRYTANLGHYDKLCSKPMIVETSPGNYQAHFIMAVNLPKEWDKQKIEKYAERVFKSVVYYYHGDIGSADPYHLRKLPGFFNTKYREEPPRVRFPSYEEMKKLYVGLGFERAEFKEYIDKALDVQNEIDEHIRENTIYPAPRKVRGQKRWIDFYNEYAEKVGSKERVDLSRVDMSYSVYLAAHGFSFDDIAIALEAESKDIAMRKPGHLVDYLKRTVDKAFHYVFQSIEESVHRATSKEQQTHMDRSIEMGD